MRGGGGSLLLGGGDTGSGDKAGESAAGEVGAVHGQYLAKGEYFEIAYSMPQRRKNASVPFF